jgi:hypothetical protein
MKQIVYSILLLVFTAGTVTSQNKCDMYNINKKIDVPIATVGFVGTGYGLYKRFKKPDSDSAVIASLSTDHMNKWDKGATQSYNKGRVSDALFVLGVTSPWVLYSDKQIKHDNRVITMMYLQTVGISAAGYALTAGTVDKYRPYAYNCNAPMKRRMSSHAKNSFYCGHPSVMAAGAFFTAKVYSDYYPRSAKSYALWSYAAASTVACGYLRYKGGYHFPSDIVIGMATGTAIGILVPTLHKNRKREAPPENGSGVPTGVDGADCQRISVVIKF